MKMSIASSTQRNDVAELKIYITGIGLQVQLDIKHILGLDC